MKKGFTLVEVLAVILVLSIILVIAMPKVMDIIEKSRKTTFINDVNESVSIIKLHYQDNYGGTLRDSISYTLENNKIKENNVEVKYIKDINLTGTVEIDSDGNVKLNVRNEFYCGIKNFNDNSVQAYKLTEDECNN